MDVHEAVSRFTWNLRRIRQAPAFVASLTGTTPDRVRPFLLDHENHGVHQPKDVLLYLLVRSLRPRVVVETGVRHGWSSRAILAALLDNGGGHLTSIDLPFVGKGHVNADGRLDGAHVDAVEDTGRAVPQYLRSRWTLLIGSSEDLLGAQLGQPVDLFFHDSDHSRSLMLWEYGTAWPSIRPGGVLYSDDVDWNDAFWTFARSVDHRALAFKPTIASGMVGGIRKQ